MEYEKLTTYSFGISTKKDSLRLIRNDFKIRPHIKFIQKLKKIPLGKFELGTYKIDVPFTIEKVKRSRSWLGNGFQSDDINCHSEWDEEVKVYDKEKLSEFIIKSFKDLGIDYIGKTNQIY